MENEKEKQKSAQSEKEQSPYEELYGKQTEADKNKDGKDESAGDFGSASKKPGPESKDGDEKPEDQSSSIDQNKK